MNLRCKDGDLAVVVGDFPQCEANIGRIVEVRGPIETLDHYPVPCWKIKPIDDRDFLIVESDWSLTIEVITDFSRAVHPDYWLLPIRPPQEKVADEEEKVEPDRLDNMELLQSS